MQSSQWIRWASLAWVVLATGCLSTRITNLTPRQVVRPADGLVSFEARWDSNQRAIREDSFRPYVVVGGEKFPMQRTLLTSNRWEALVPVPPDRRFVNYHFKFDYEIQGFGKRHPDSRLSAGYQLEILPP
jgi:hypothetical protein